MAWVCHWWKMVVVAAVVVVVGMFVDAVVAVVRDGWNEWWAVSGEQQQDQ